MSNFSFALGFGFSSVIGAGVKSSFEELHAYTREHEDQEHRDEDDVLNRPDRHEHALDYVL